MTPVKEEKKKSKVKIERFNPSSRRNEVIEVEEIQIGTLKYRDLSDNYECTIGFETEAINADMFTKKNVTFKKSRRITRLQWDVSRHNTVGERVILSPRDIQILDAILTYLKKMGFHIG